VSLLLIALLTAAVPVASLGLAPPSSIRTLEKSFVVGIVTLAAGTFAVSRFHPLGLFGFAHLLYLLIVVTVPLLLGTWYITAFVRRRRTRLIRLAGAVAVLIALLGVWGTHIEPNWLRTDRVALAGVVQEPIVVGVLADLQTPNVGKHEWNAINTLIAEQPDLVLVPGDLLQGSPDEIAESEADFIALLAALRTEVPFVGVVSGDSDYPLDRLIRIVEAGGAVFLDNQTTEVQVRGQRIRLAGVAVPGSASRLDTIAALSQQDPALTILLAHRPDVVYDLPVGSDVDLIVSGHTHGGQIALPFIGPLVTFSKVPRSLGAGGLQVVDNYPVYVSTGVGMERHSAPQVRFGVRPSIGIIVIVPPN